MTAEQAARRYSFVDLEVTGHRAHGGVFRTAEGESGFVDSADISDVPIDAPQRVRAALRPAASGS